MKITKIDGPTSTILLYLTFKDEIFWSYFHKVNEFAAGIGN